MQYNLTIQREFARGWVWEGGYVGTRGDNLLGPGGMVNPALTCTQLKPCVIPNNIAQNVLVPAGTPFVTKNPDGTITITGSTATNADARVPQRSI